MDDCLGFLGGENSSASFEGKIGKNSMLVDGNCLRRTRDSPPISACSFVFFITRYFDVILLSLF